MEDRELIELLFARSEQAIVELDRKYGWICRSIANRILQNEQDAEECVNDAYLAIWNTVPPQRPDPLSAYLCRIVRNRSVARYHQNTAQKRNGVYDLALDELEHCLSSMQTVETELEAAELSRRLDAFLATLGQKERMLFVRRYWYSDSVAELAERFHMRPNTVSVRLSRTREKLRRELKKEGLMK